VTSGVRCLRYHAHGRRMHVTLGSWEVSGVVEVCMLWSPVYGSYGVLLKQILLEQKISDKVTYDSEQYNRLKLGVTICLSHVALRTTDQLRVRGI
jgi:hypothetical protein